VNPNAAKTAIVWFRNDLRLADNPALTAACQSFGTVVPVFIWAPEEELEWAPGSASRWWLHQSLAKLRDQLVEHGTQLVLRVGPSLKALQQLIQETGAQGVYWNRRYEPAVIRRDTQIKSALRDQGVQVETFNAGLLHEPWTIQNKSRRPFQVFTPFWKACLEAADPEPPLSAPKTLRPLNPTLASLAVAELQLEPVIDWATHMRRAWTPGEAGAATELQRFLNDAFVDYESAREQPGRNGSSRLSPHLHFGEISPRQVVGAMKACGQTQGSKDPSWRSSQFYAEVGWREFAHHLLFHFPDTPQRPLRPEFEHFPWRTEPKLFKSWQRGRTGYPLVDAGMRQLWKTGWMHNRVRMVVASFLVKNLLISWQEGAAWFWDTLVDADLANNTLGWQWTAGCGADAAPFFRVFNPVLQGEKFDPQGDYVRHWIPELARVPNRWIHRPWEAPATDLRASGVELGSTYPEPVVTLFSSRERALEAYRKLKS